MPKKHEKRSLLVGDGGGEDEVETSMPESQQVSVRRDLF